MKLHLNWYSLKLCMIMIIVFFLQFIPGVTDAGMLDERANNLQVWRFISAIFLHANASHLLYNLIALLFFGLMLEKTVGKKTFMIIFFSAGIIANVVAINYYDGSLGASGAIYGLIGALTILKPLTFVFAFNLPLPLIVAAALWITGDILRSLGAFGPTSIGSIAHIAGILVGIFFGIKLRKNK